jgi:hypothetical protein
MRYIRAFFIALKLTLTGQVPQPRPIEIWVSEARQKLTRIQALADAENTAVTVRIDRRDMTMQTILQIIAFHLDEEYPRLLQQPDGLNYIYATNLDDHFRLTRLEAELPESPLRQAVTDLSDHLQAVPRAENR